MLSWLLHRQQWRLQVLGFFFVCQNPISLRFARKHSDNCRTFSTAPHSIASLNIRRNTSRIRLVEENGNIGRSYPLHETFDLFLTDLIHCR